MLQVVVVEEVLSPCNNLPPPHLPLSNIPKSTTEKLFKKIVKSRPYLI
jgi:hypothetical protein